MKHYIVTLVVDVEGVNPGDAALAFSEYLSSVRSVEVSVEDVEAGGTESLEVEL